MLLIIGVSDISSYESVTWGESCKSIVGNSGNKKPKL